MKYMWLVVVIFVLFIVSLWYSREHFSGKLSFNKNQNMIIDPLFRPNKGGNMIVDPTFMPNKSGRMIVDPTF